MKRERINVEKRRKKNKERKRLQESERERVRERERKRGGENYSYNPVSSAGIRKFRYVIETGFRVTGTVREAQLKMIWAWATTRRAALTDSSWVPYLASQELS